MMQLLIPAAAVPLAVAQLPGEDRSFSTLLIAGMLVTATLLHWLVRASSPKVGAAGTEVASGNESEARHVTAARHRPVAWGRIGGWTQAASPSRSRRSMLLSRPGVAALAAVAVAVVVELLFGAAVAVVLSMAVTLPVGLVAAHAVARRTDRAEPALYLEKLAHSGRLVTTAPTPKLAATLTTAAIDLGFDVACLLLLEEDSERFTVCGAVGFVEDIVGTTVYASEGILGMEPAARLARRVIVADNYPASPFNNPNLVTEIRAALAAPLSAGGRPIGVLAAAKRSEGFTSNEVHAFEVLALQGGLGFETVARRRAALEAAIL